jgi:hypothetical protein
MMKRREFFVKSAVSSIAVVFGSAFVLRPVQASDACGNGIDASVNIDPRHQLVVSQADILAGVEKTYHIQGTAGHDHLVTLTAADFASLAAGNEIEEKSTFTDFHQHTVHVKCS